MQPTEEQQKRAKECSDKVNAILKEYNCSMKPLVIIDANGVQIRVPITAEPSIIEPVSPLEIVK
jgi:hypothetical protein